MRVKPVGELVFEKDGHEHYIPASQLSEGEQKKEADGIHGESEDWSIIFTAGSPFGGFAWYVTYTVGNQGLVLIDSEITKAPVGVEVIRDISSKSV